MRPLLRVRPAPAAGRCFYDENRRHSGRSRVASGGGGQMTGAGAAHGAAGPMRRPGAAGTDGFSAASPPGGRRAENAGAQPRRFCGRGLIRPHSIREAAAVLVCAHPADSGLPAPVSLFYMRAAVRTAPAGGGLSAPAPISHLSLYLRDQNM